MKNFKSGKKALCLYKLLENLLLKLIEHFLFTAITINIISSLFKSKAHWLEAALFFVSRWEYIKNKIFN